LTNVGGRFDRHLLPRIASEQLLDVIHLLPAHVRRTISGHVRLNGIVSLQRRIPLQPIHNRNKLLRC
jgi:hypothetical protein